MPGEGLASVIAGYAWTRLRRLGPALGVVAALIAIYQFIPETPDVQIDLVARSDPTVLATRHLTANRPVVADTLVVAEPILAHEPVHIVANHLQFGDSGSLAGHDIIVFATRITAGRITANGAAGKSPGEMGSAGGEIQIVAARIDGTIIEATGGRGANGEDGAGGLPGGNGDCAGFGRWVGATDGGNGQNGMNGSRGGDGGQIRLLVAEDGGFPAPRATGGQGGSPGVGGPGGPGGTGCTGLGGSQSSHPNGQPGRDGDRGQAGATGGVLQREIRFRDVKGALENVDLADVHALRAVVERLWIGP